MKIIAIFCNILFQWMDMVKKIETREKIPDFNILFVVLIKSDNFHKVCKNFQLYARKKERRIEDRVRVTKSLIKP